MKCSYYEIILNFNRYTNINNNLYSKVYTDEYYTGNGYHIINQGIRLYFYLEHSPKQAGKNNK